MNPQNLVGQREIGALRAVLRPSGRSPRPIHHPEMSSEGGFGGGR